VDGRVVSATLRRRVVCSTHLHLSFFRGQRDPSRAEDSSAARQTPARRFRSAGSADAHVFAFFKNWRSPTWAWWSIRFRRSHASPSRILLATYAFAAQIYRDFSGYSDIAPGTARLSG
jgi:hypothetical protein